MNIEYNNNLSADDYCMLRKSVGWSDISIIIVEKAIEKSDYIITAELNSTKIGMGRVINDGTQAFILDVVVHPDYQGFGIGKSMMLKIMGYLKDNLQQGQNILVNLSATKGREDFIQNLVLKSDQQKNLVKVWRNGYLRVART